MKIGFTGLQFTKNFVLTLGFGITLGLGLSHMLGNVMKCNWAEFAYSRADNALGTAEGSKAPGTNTIKLSLP